MGVLEVVVDGKSTNESELVDTKQVEELKSELKTRYDSISGYGRKWLFVPSLFKHYTIQTLYQSCVQTLSLPKVKLEDFREVQHQAMLLKLQSSVIQSCADFESKSCQAAPISKLTKMSVDCQWADGRTTKDEVHVHTRLTMDKLYFTTVERIGGYRGKYVYRCSHAYDLDALACHDHLVDLITKSDSFFHTKFSCSGK